MGFFLFSRRKQERTIPLCGKNISIGFLEPLFAVLGIESWHREVLDSPIKSENDDGLCLDYYFLKK